MTVRVVERVERATIVSHQNEAGEERVYMKLYPDAGIPVEIELNPYLVRVLGRAILTWRERMGGRDNAD